jgi:hypothetical protein
VTTVQRLSWRPVGSSVESEPRRLELASPLEHAAITLMRGAVGLHAGILFRTSDQRCRILHLAFHYRLACEAEPTRWAFVSAAIDPIDLQVLAGMCATLDAVRPEIPYGLRRGTSRFDEHGRFVPGPGDAGLTCATFIQAVFDWARIPLLDEATWEVRDEDREAQQLLLGFLRRGEAATEEHLAAVEAEVGCMRFRTEEVAASSAIANRPVPFRVASEEGVRIRSSFDRLGL